MPRTPAALSRTPFHPVALFAAVMLAVGVPAFGADSDKPADPDLAKVQGRWERAVPKDSDLPYRKATKEVKGNRETVTYYDADGKVVHQHRVDFKLSKAGDVGVFTFSNMEITAGEQKGEKVPGSFSYVYRVSGNHFREVSGLLPGDESEPSITLWTKAKADAADAGDAVTAADKPVPKDEPKAAALDAKALAGTWEPTMSQRGGDVEPEEQTRRHRLIFKDDHFTITRDGEMMLEGTYKLNKDAKPVEIDMTVEDSRNPDDKGKTVLGIIELTGDGMKWSTGGPRSTQRPKTFESEAGSRDMVVVLKREK